MDDEARRPGESQLDHRDRLLRKRLAEENERKTELFLKYMVPAESVARSLAAEIEPILKDVIGKTTVKVHSPQTPPGISPQTAKTTVTIEAHSSGNTTANVHVMVEPILQGPDSPDDLQYKLLGSLSCQTGAGSFSRDLPTARSKIGKPIPNVAEVEKQLKEFLHLA